ncbi:response regulator [Pseudohongiella sp.]|uniref:Response regulatory domain-containing protein n=1 Tax=marine sediment metagenome TaxID=412755 RepID=A0A0F9YH07_9ZZZZ|nr:response regulator [Pseudohongiella sp.]HDZ09227.1 response regulator [Pseudohongiella sp.]HEA63345.1 response regulator [Pseudohongiella sp.]
MVNVYIADDDPLLIDLLRFRLERKSYLVRSTNDGEEALEQILASPPDLVILDYQMPGRNAHEIVKVLKQDAVCRDIPILVLASQWSEEDVIEALQQGITDYVIKPFSPDELLFRIERALKK